MNIGLIFAGGSGVRMNTKGLPKQFLEMNGKAIIIHTIEHFEKCKAIDAIVIVCLKDYIEYLEDLLDRDRITKVKKNCAGRFLRSGIHLSWTLCSRGNFRE